MLSSSFGKNFKITISGGSHEPQMNLEITGLPSGKLIDMNKLQSFLHRRRPGQSSITTSRIESDLIYINIDDDYVHPNEFYTSSDKMSFIIKNENYNKKEYNLTLPRPGHADLPAYLKYGDKVNMSGGGPFSGRMTAMMCIAGGIAIQLLEEFNIKIDSQALSIGSAKNRPVDLVAPVSLPITDMMIDEIKYAREQENSVGGIIEVFATGVKSGLGGPLSQGGESVLSPIFYAIPGVKGVEFGNGFTATTLMGSENNDDFFSLTSDGNIVTATNNHGGFLGGITTGMPIIARLAFKPTPSIGKAQYTINLNTGKPEKFKIQGRHDPCIVPRATAVCEAAMAIGILDMMLEPKPLKVCNANLKELSTLRNSIDEIDNQLIDLLNKRMEISKAVAKCKIDNNFPIEHTARETEILNKVGPKFEKIYKEIFKTSKDIQKKVIQHGGKESGSK